MQNLDILIKFLSHLGLEFEESKVYLTLMNSGGLTVLELSRASKISRTNVYRIVERLKNLGFVEELLDDKKKIIHPVGMHKLEMLVKEQENKTDFLKSFFPEISKIIPASNSISQPNLTTLFYKGVDGIQQIYRDAMKSKTEVLLSTKYLMNHIISEDFFNNFSRETIYNRVHIRELVNKEFKSIPRDNHKLRFISPEVFKLQGNMIIFNESFYFIYEVSSDWYGVEIRNKEFTEMQSSMFENIWRLGVDFL